MILVRVIHLKVSFRFDKGIVHDKGIVRKGIVHTKVSFVFLARRLARVCDAPVTRLHLPRHLWCASSLIAWENLTAAPD
jgi:hypothetical protein